MLGLGETTIRGVETVTTAERKAAVLRQLAEGRVCYLERMIALGGTDEQLRIAHAADVEINALRAIIRQLGGEI